MKKLLLAVLATCGVAYLPAASADVIRTVHMDFKSGATFDGDLTFTDGYTGLLDVDGTLAGGSWGTRDINWAWWIGTSQPYVARDIDGNAATYEDWLMDGTSTSWSTYIGISWYFPVSGDLTFNLNADIYHAGVLSTDSLVAARTVPEPMTLTMLGAGLIGLGLARRRRVKA